jgi:hypothetical protein
MRTNGWLVAAAVAGLSAAAPAAEVYVAPTGSDTNPGTLERPFASIKRAQEAVKAGDTVWIRGGTYALKEADIAKKQGIFAYVNYLDKSGEKGKPISYFAYKDEKPVFDLSAIKPAMRVDAFYVSGSWLHFRGIEVTGVQVVLTGHTQSICFANDGSNNIYERLSMHDGQAIGIYSLRGSDNLFLNCDAYRNWDSTSEGGRGGNVDGFGCHPPKGSTGNVFRGCRAWYNSDDGYDCIHAYEAVTFDHCWAFYNGTNADGKTLGDGNGFKAGGWASTPADRLPNPIPRHTVKFCLAVGNKANGVYANHQVGGGDFFNNTAFRNGADFNFLARTPDNSTDVDGWGQKIFNNLAYKGRTAVVRFDPQKSEAKNNSWQLDLHLSDADFQSVDEKEFTAPRQANGDLPVIKFLHPADKSRIVDGGADIGFPFNGKAPDLGCFEH